MSEIKDSPASEIGFGSSLKPHFSRFFAADSERLHFAAHSHHPWPDVSFDAQVEAWNDAAELADTKWKRIFGEVLPETRGHIARILGLSDPESLVFAPSTHEFLVRILSCFEESVLKNRPVRILTTDGEFHSFTRQRLRWEESGRVTSTLVPTEPRESFADRFVEAVRGDGAGREPVDLIFLSRVFFDSSFAPNGLERILEAASSPTTWIVFDGYHEFMARPANLGSVEHRCFYLGGGYKYAMSGEGVCFLHCPPGFGPRPVNTGWFAGFGAIEENFTDSEVAYAQGGQRFAGATLDPTAFYRMNSVMRLWEKEGVSVEAIHRHVRSLQSYFLELVGSANIDDLRVADVIPNPASEERGNFLTFRTPNAGDVSAMLLEKKIVTDARGDRLRFGFGIYQDKTDIERLVQRLSRPQA